MLGGLLMAEGKKLYKLIGPDGKEYLSEEKGQLGGNRKAKIYGRLDCSAAIRSLSQGYAEVRVFFKDEETAQAAGYRPCGSCMKEQYKRWKRGELVIPNKPN